MKHLFQYLLDNSLTSTIITLTVIEISPIKINPWRWLGMKLKTLLVGDLYDDINSLREELKTFRQEFIEDKVQTKRWNILAFATSCRRGDRHTEEEWKHCMDELKWYEHYCEKHEIPNGVISESAKYLRDICQTVLKENDFI